MIQPGTVVVVAIAAAVSVGLFMVFAGLNRIPWRYGLLIGAGATLVLGAAMVASGGDAVLRIDPGQLVFIGAIGGGLAVRGYERGMARRRATVERIVDAPPEIDI